jgi:acid phosphatase (class A)
MQTATLIAPLTLALLALPAAALAEGSGSATMRMPAEKPELHYLDAADYLPQRVLALPPARESAAEALELAEVKNTIAAASAERRTQATWDADHEDPSAFNAVLGRDLAKLPATWDLLVTVQDEAYALTGKAKEAFARMRPYSIDAAVQTCTKEDPVKPAKSYPSGHATVGYSVGWTLARLVPDYAPYILDRARDYAESRVICGVHFRSDIEASHVLATLVAERLLADPRLADKVAKARAELATAP